MTPFSISLFNWSFIHTANDILVIILVRYEAYTLFLRTVSYMWVESPSSLKGCLNLVAIEALHKLLVIIKVRWRWLHFHVVLAVLVLHRNRLPIYGIYVSHWVAQILVKDWMARHFSPFHVLFGRCLEVFRAQFKFLIGRLHERDIDWVSSLFRDFCISQLWYL